MAYSLNKLTTVAECDELIKLSTEERDALSFKQSALQRQMATLTDDSEDYGEELKVVRVKVKAHQTIDAELPEGDAKKDNEIQLKNFLARESFLERQMEKKGSVAKLVRECDIEQLDAEVKVLTDFINQVQARKTELGG